MGKTAFAKGSGPLAAREGVRPAGASSSGRSPWVVLLVSIAAIFAAFVILIIVGAFLLGVGGVTSATPKPSGLTELPEVSGAPDADVVMVVTPVRESGPEVDRQLVQDGGVLIRPNQVVVTGSATYVSRVQSEYGVTDIYSWSEVDANAGPVRGVDECYGGVGGYGGFFSTCSSDDEAGPRVSWRSAESTSGTAFVVEVLGLPSEAAWIVVDTTSGYQPAAAVVDGIAYLEWQPLDGDRVAIADPSGVRALDTNFEEVWRANIG